MIQICLPLHDIDGSYSKYVGTTLCSLLEHTGKRICVHILHDETLGSSNKKLLVEIVNRYGHIINFHLVRPHAAFLDSAYLKKYTIGTFFRLYLSDLLEIPKVLYLDADLIVHLDIQELWETEMDTEFCAACMDEPLQRELWKHPMCTNGFFDVRTYFNAGVLLLNLEKIRNQYDVIREGEAFFQRYPDSPCLDQDFLNDIFREKHKILEQKYDRFVGVRRLEKTDKIEEAIYHYSGEDGRPHFRTRDIYDELWWKYFQRTPWGTGRELELFYERKLFQMEQLYQWRESAFERIRHRKVILWGASGQLHDPIRKVLNEWLQESDYYVDRDPARCGCICDGLPVYAPEYLKKERQGDFVIVVITMQYYVVRSLLLQQGYVEHEDFLDGRRLLPEDQGGYSMDIV